MTDQTAQVASGRTVTFGLEQTTGQVIQLPGSARPMRHPATGTAAGSTGVRSGYKPSSPFADAVFNRGLALLFIVLTSPILVTIWVVLRLSSRDPVLYRGVRLGLHRKPFNILKFRTLTLDAAQATTDGTLPKRTLLETRVGSYLRKSRLDELPQLINILRGDMVFFGPRPVRPALLPLYEAEVDQLDARFTVRPGLVGYSQALMPHSASKRVRGRLVARCTRAPVRYFSLLGFVLRVGWHVLRRGVLGLFEALGDVASPLSRHTFLKSGFSAPKGGTVMLSQASGGGKTAGLLGVSDEIIQFVTTLPAELGPARLKLTRKLKSGRKVSLTLDADIRAVAPVGPGKSGFIGYAVYELANDCQRYRMERYFLDQCVIPV